MESKDEAVVAIRVGFPNRNKINIIGYYRQWNMLGNKHILNFNTSKQAKKLKIQLINGNPKSIKEKKQ